MNAVADPEVVRNTASEILSRPEFGDHRNLLERALDWLVGALSDLLGSFVSALASGSGILGVLVQITVVLGAVALIAFVIRAIFQAAMSRRRKPPGDGLVVVFGEKADPAGLAEEARSAEAEGRWKQAALARYRHLVASLVLAGMLADVPGRTTGEYRIEHASIRPESAPGFDRATAMFERAYYGDAHVGADQCAEMRRLAAELMPGSAKAGSGTGGT